MAKLNPDGTLNEDWTDPYGGLGSGQAPPDPSADTLENIFPGQQNTSRDQQQTQGTSTPNVPDPSAPGYTPNGTVLFNPKNPANVTNPDGSYTVPHLGSGSGGYTFDPSIGYYMGGDGNYYSKDPTTGAYSLVPGYSKGGAGYGFTPNPNPGQAGSGSQVNDVLSSLLTKLFGGSDPNAALRGQLSDKFGSLINQYSQPVSPTDPVIQANTDAYHGIEQRNLGQYGEMAAERAHAEGVPVGAFDSAVGNATSSAGRDEAANTASLMTNETNARRAALGGVLGQAGQFSTVSDAQRLQEELSVLSDATGNQQFYDSLASGIGGQQNSLDSLIATLLGK